MGKCSHLNSCLTSLIKRSDISDLVVEDGGPALWGELIQWICFWKQRWRSSHEPCSSSVGCSSPPECGFLFALRLVWWEQELSSHQSSFVTFQGFSVFWGTLLTEVAFPRAPLLGFQEPCAEGDKLVPGALRQPLSLVSRLQSRGFVQPREQKCFLQFYSVVNKTNQNTKKNTW